MDDQPRSPSHQTDALRSSHPVDSADAPAREEFEVTIQPDEDDPDLFHITSISPRPRQ